jgi:hypothetical protein
VVRRSVQLYLLYRRYQRSTTSVQNTHAGPALYSCCRYGCTYCGLAVYEYVVRLGMHAFG